MEYNGYIITVKQVGNIFESQGTKGEFIETSYGDTEEDAIKWLKQKIDMIDRYKDIYKIK